MLGIGNYLWRLIPANPILLRVVQNGGKRKRDLFIRCAYLGTLVFLVVFMLLSSAGSLASASLSDLAKQSAGMFYWMSYVQLGLVCLLAPVFTAGAITQERDSQTYDILLATPLTNGQIVLGSLLSRVFFVVALLISGIPIFAITQIFGGVAIRDIVLSFLIASATALVTGAMAMAIAAFKFGTRRTLFSFYLFIMLYLAIPLLLEGLGYGRYPWKFDASGNSTSHVSWFAAVHPFLAQRLIFGEPGFRPPEPGMVRHLGWFWSWWLSSPHTFYITFMFVLSFLLVTPSIPVLRRLAQSTRTWKMWLLETLRLSRGDRTRSPRRVWSNPIAWREAKTKASANRAIVLRYGFMLAGIAAAVVLLILSSTSKPARAVVGVGGYNQADQTVMILVDGESSFYKVRPLIRTAGTRVFLDGTQEGGPELLREGMTVDPDSITLDAANGTGKVIKSIRIHRPQTAVNNVAARQFLLGLVLLELAVILLILTQASASTVTREKEDGSLDLLLSTPITSHYYIWGKLRGLVSFVLPLMAVPMISILMFVIRDMFRNAGSSGTLAGTWTVYPEAILILPGTLVMVSAFAAILGMQMSLRCRRTVMAVMSSVGIVGGICGILWLCGQNAALSPAFGPVGIGIGAFSPFTLISLLVAPPEPARSIAGAGSARAMGSAEARLFLLFAGWAAAGCYALVVSAMYKSMVRNFDMTIRKQAT